MDDPKDPDQTPPDDQSSRSRRQFVRRVGSMLFAVTVVDLADATILGKVAFAQSGTCYSGPGDDTCGHSSPGNPAVSNPDGACGTGNPKMRDQTCQNTNQSDGNCGNPTPGGPNPTDRDLACQQYTGGAGTFDQDQSCNQGTNGGGGQVNSDASCSAGTGNYYNVDESCHGSSPGNNTTNRDESCSSGTSSSGNPQVTSKDENCNSSLSNGYVDYDNSCGTNVDDKDESCHPQAGYVYGADNSCTQAGQGKDGVCDTYWTNGYYDRDGPNPYPEYYDIFF